MSHVTGELQIERQAAKLLELHYDDGIDPDLFLSEQTRLRSEKRQAQAQLEAAATKTSDLNKKLDTAIAYLMDCRNMYRDADDTVKRQLNSEFFDTFVIDDEHLTAIKSEIYEALTAPELKATLETELEQLKEADAAESHGDGEAAARKGSETPTRKNRTANRGQCGSRLLELVGVSGIEPDCPLRTERLQRSSPPWLFTPNVF